MKLNLPGENNRQRARALFDRYPALVAGQSARLVFAGQQQTRSRRIVRFVQRYKGLSVLGAQVIVTLDTTGQIMALSSSAVPVQLASVQPVLTPAEATAKVAAQLKRDPPDTTHAQLVILAEGPSRLVYRVLLPFSLDARGRVHLVDAKSGAYLGWRRGLIIDQPDLSQGVGR